nr:hypothetical protein RKE32_33815 [Streptomyces sp. Li-HN-5-13]
MTGRPALLCALALAALAGCLVLTFTTGGTLGNRPPLYGWYAADALLFGGALLLLRRVPERQVARLVLAGGVLVAATGLLVPPRTSDDAHRYVWDGRVQAAGISPYAHAPQDPALAPLRDPGLFPADDGCRGWDERRTADGACTRINRPAVHTVYPPLAEAWFLAQHPFGDRVRTAQAAGALLAVATTGALLAVTGGRRRAALWAWCPGVAVWAVNDAHVDVLGTLLTVAGLGLAVRRRAAAAARCWGRRRPSNCCPRWPCRGCSPGRWAARRAAGAAVAGRSGPGSGRSGPRAGCSRCATCRTCWRPAPGCSATCPATCARRATGRTAWNGSDCCGRPCPTGRSRGPPGCCSPRWSSGCCAGVTRDVPGGAPCW